MKTDKLILVGVAVVICLTAVAYANIAPKEKATDFKLPTVSGKQFTLSKCFKKPGSVVLLDIWATWCPPCRAQIPCLIGLNAKLKGNSVKFVGVGIDDNADKVKSFVRQNKMTYTVCTDPGGATVGPIYKVEGIPCTYIIDKNGVIRFVHSGFPSDPESQKAEIDKMESEIKSLL